MCVLSRALGCGTYKYALGTQRFKIANVNGKQGCHLVRLSLTCKMECLYITLPSFKYCVVVYKSGMCKNVQYIGYSGTDLHVISTNKDFIDQQYNCAIQGALLA